MRLRTHTTNIVVCIFLVLIGSQLWARDITAQSETVLRSTTPQVGVYYFPGWKDDAEPSRARPWQAVDERGRVRPLFGYYDEGNLDVARMQLATMRRFGISFVVYDWYWKSSGQPRLNHAIENYRNVDARQKPRVAVMWANHAEAPKSLDDFDAMVGHLAGNVFSDPQYLSIDERLLFVVFSPKQLRDRASSFGATAKALIDRMRGSIRASLGKELFVVGVTHALATEVFDRMIPEGYDGATGYNYHFGLSGTYQARRSAHSYSELAQAYSETWQWFATQQPLPYILPISTGWDRSAWGGSKDPFHDACVPSSEEFADHVRDAKDWLQSSRTSIGIGIICCWNEYGEGAVLEPTTFNGYDFLRAVESEFVSPRN